MANKIYKLKVGDGISSYDQLKFLGRKLTTKEKTYAVNSIVQKVLDYFKVNPIEYGLNGETDRIRPIIEAALNNGEHAYEFNLRTDTPYNGDDVININGMQITANYQYKTIKSLDESFQLPKPGFNTKELDVSSEEPEIPTT